MSLPRVTGSRNVVFIGVSVRAREHRRDQDFAMPKTCDATPRREATPRNHGLVSRRRRHHDLLRPLSLQRRRGYPWVMKIVVRWLLLAAALLLVAQIYSGVVVASFTSALIAALVLGLFNTLLRPVLVLLTLPVTVVTLGLFLFVINALMFFFAASVLQGFSVTGFGAALIGSLLYSLCGLVIDVAMERMFSK